MEIKKVNEQDIEKLVKVGNKLASIAALLGDMTPAFKGDDGNPELTPIVKTAEEAYDIISSFPEVKEKLLEDD